MNDPHAPPFTRDFLTDGYISHTLGTPNTDSYLVRLFQIAATTLVQAIRHQSGAFYALNRPSYHIPPAISILGREAWLVDYAVRPGGSVVPQQLWSPQGQGDQSRYVDRPQYRMHVFFVNMDGSLGVPVVNAAAGHMQLRGADLPPQLVDRTTIKIRIGWPGYPPSEYQVQLRPAGNPITFERFVQLVGTRVRRFLEDCERVSVRPFNWFVGHGNITSDEVMLIGLVQVSEASWMTILQLTSRVVRGEDQTRRR